MLKRLDKSVGLSKLIENISNFAAQYRGLPIVIGIALVVLSMFVQGADVFAQSKLLEFVGVITHNLGVLIALIGIAVAIPLGK